MRVSFIAAALSLISSGLAFNASEGILRGVNIGGWLVFEKWLLEGTNNPLVNVNATDQWTLDSTPGAAEKLKQHWDTWFTEEDMRKIKSYGLNAIRVPIGFWAYDNEGTPYIKGADAYLEKAISWAQATGLKVLIDLHGLPGGQNPWGHSGRENVWEWLRPENLRRSISVLETMAKKYGSEQYAGTVVGLQVVNEPLPKGDNGTEPIKKFARDAYRAVKAQATNKNLLVVMSDAFAGVDKWIDFARGLNASRTFGIDTHLYQLYTEEDNKLNQEQHIQKVCSRPGYLLNSTVVMPTFVGEWSAATNICVQPNGTTTPGTSCTTPGCQCQVTNYRSWNAKMVEQTRRFVEDQIDVFERSTSGYFLWTYRGPNQWGLINGIEGGFIPNPITSRKYRASCFGWGKAIDRRPSRTPSPAGSTGPLASG